MKQLALVLNLVAWLIACNFATAQTKPAFGWKPSPHGVAGAPIETHPKFKVAPLPAAATIDKWFYRTDQQDRGACVAFSGVEAYDAVHQKDFRGSHVKLSYLDTYQRCLVTDGNFPNDEGTYGSTLLKVFAAGVLTEGRWPYSKPLDVLAPVTAANVRMRAQHVTIKSYAIPSDDGGYAVRQCIANLKVPVIVGSYWYNNGFDARLVDCPSLDTNGKPVTFRRYVLPMPKGNPVGGHEVPIIGYDDNMIFPGGERGGVQFHNHWRGFGDSRGSAWAPAAWFFSPRYAEDKHAIELVIKTSR